jgi:hypothetical protein
MAKSLEERIQRVEDIQEIQKLMSRYAYLNTAHLHDECVEAVFSKKTPGQKVQIDGWGIWEGFDAAHRCFGLAHNWVERTMLGLPGTLLQHTLTTPLIEVAGDGKTARGLWISPGHEARPSATGVTAFWVWVYYSDDFVKEDGAWKIWHHRVTEIIFSRADADWTSANVLSDELLPEWPEECKPDRPSPPQWKYSPDAVTVLDPAPPEPYDTWSDDLSYIQ